MRISIFFVLNITVIVYILIPICVCPLRTTSIDLVNCLLTSMSRKIYSRSFLHSTPFDGIILTPLSLNL